MKRSDRQRWKVSGNQPQRKPEKGHANPHQDGAQNQKCKWDGSARVSGEVSVQFPKDLTSEYQTAQKDNSAHNRKQRLIEWLTFAAVVIYAGLTLWMAVSANRSADFANKSLKLTRRQFALDQRPYIKIESPRLGYIDGLTGQTGSVPMVGKALIADLHYQNIGKSPAVNIRMVRFVFFGPKARDAYLSQKIDMSYAGRDSILYPGEGPQQTTAASLNDQATHQSSFASKDELINWDGSWPIVVFGMMNYEDTFGDTFCQDFAEMRFQDNEAWFDIRETKKADCHDSYKDVP